MAIESVVGAIISKIAELMVEPVGRQFRYMFCFNHFVEEFELEKEKLVSETERQQHDVKAAERNVEEIYGHVETWLVGAKNKIEGAKPLENEIGKNGKCFTWCPNCMRQFKLSKALAKKSETFRKHLDLKPTKVSHRAPMQFLPSKEFTPSKSSEEALEQIMETLKDDSVNMIGLYGMGGAGKTTLVQEVVRRAKELQPPLDEVLMATVSQNPNVRDIQYRMAEHLDLDFKEISTNAWRAERLWQRLKGKKMLIILDDVWKHIHLEEIGIQFGDDHRGCKILLTTRRRDICSYMVCQKKVFLGLFSEKEAWDLFRTKAGLDDGDSTLNILARKVASECDGLPIALVTVGKALRDKSEVEWEVAFTQLKKSEFLDMEHIEEKNAYACLKLSYDYLESNETKDYNIPIEDLTRYAVGYGVGYGLHQDGEPIGDAKKRVYVEIKKLKDCCMLLDSEYDEHVKMHDLVRDVAIRIALSKEYGFMVLEKWPTSIESFEGCTTISLMGNKLAELPEVLVCSQLKVLLLEVDDGLNVPQRFFEGMKEIEVLSLEGGCLSLQSLELSTKLQSLVLTECGCKDLIWLGKLQRLKILVFQWCSSIEELPDEIGDLKELRLLDVTGCYRLRRIPVNLIGRLKKLEELLIGDYSFDGWDSTGGMNASLTELNSLSQLAVLSLRIPKVECIPRDFVFPVSLRKYHIILGNGFVAGRYPTSTRFSLGGTSLNAKKTFEQLFLRKLESVEVRDCGDVFTLFPARLRQGLKNLKKVIVFRCKSLEEVFELGEADEGSSEEKELLSSLTKLHLSKLPELKCIWKGPTRHVSLKSLVVLKLDSLDKLTFIFTTSLAQSLPKLERLEIRDCGELKHIIREEDGEREIIPESPCFPQLKTIDISFCDKLEYVSLSHNRDGIIKFPQLIELSLQLRSNYSFLGPRNFDAQLPLQRLTIKGHEEVGNWLTQLQELIVSSCESLEEVFELGEADEGSSEVKEMPLLSSLTELQLSKLPELKCIWKGPTRHVSLQNLDRLILWSLDKLTFIFTPSLAQSLPKLETLVISACGELKHIIREEDGEREIIPQSPRFPQLKNISISYCDKLEYVSLSHNRDGIIKFPQLRRLHLGLSSNYSFLGPRNFDAQLPLQRLTIQRHEEVGNWLPQLQMAVHGQQNGFLQRLESVHLGDCGDVRSPFPAKLLQALKNLNSVEIEDCKSLEEVFELGEADEGSSEEKELPLRSSLTELQLSKLPQLKCIWKGPTGHVSLQSLVVLKLRSLDKLTFIFTPSLAQSLPKLERLEIRDCGELKHIIKEEDGEGEIIPESPRFPRLKTIDIYFCDKLEYVSLSHNRDGIIKFPQLTELSLWLRSNYSFLGPRNFDAQLPLQRLTIKGHEEVGNWLTQLQMVVHGQQNGFLQRLESVHLDDCGDVRAPFPALKNLKRVEIEDCKSLEEVFELGEADEGSSEEKELPLLSSLTELQLSMLPQLKCIWKGPTGHVSLQSLVFLKLGSLNKLTFIFTSSLAQSLPKLERLEIRDCGELKHIIKEEDGEGEIIPESPRFPKLKKIFIQDCGKLEYVFPVSVSPSLPNLEEMTIDRADNLKQIFYSGEGDALPTDAIIKFPRLTRLSLSNGSFFGPKNFAAQLPSLQFIKIYGHKELGILSAQLQGLTNLETLRLRSLPDMRCIWKGLVLSKLTTLEVIYLDKN
ncbi:hypothetical protein NC651_004248 [Populus alba x Populus x berolinensis]|nr:hypothetical protein NC651_004248 [Populus alba x Populus x berolinensis]